MSAPLQALAINSSDGEIHSHFGITVAGQSIAYCYIRKNACSAWKRLFFEESPSPYRPSDWSHEIEFLAQNHNLRSIAEIERHDRRVVVLRDPVERYVSAFISLFIVTPPQPILQLRRLSLRLMGRDIEDVSFDMLLDNHLPGRHPRPRRLERHFWPQVWHFAPVTYTDVIDIDRLAPAMKAMFGDAMGARYFDRPVNATATVPAYDDPDVTSLPARVLRERFAATGALPAKSSFLGGGRNDMIRSAYASDDALYAACRAKDQAVPGAGLTLEVTPAPKRPKAFDERGGRPEAATDEDF